MRNKKRNAPLFFISLGVLVVVGLTQCEKDSQVVIVEPILVTNVYKWSNGGVPDSALADINEFYRQASEKSVSDLNRIGSINRYRDLAAALKSRYFYYSERNNFPEAYKNIQEE
jgi:hypothetical protein